MSNDSAEIEHKAVAGSRLTTAQESLIFRQRLDPESSFLTLTGAWDLQGDVDVAALQQAVGIFFQRHSVLRARIRQDLRGSFFDLDSTAAPDIQAISLPIDDSNDEQANLQQYIEEQGRQILDFENGAMFRCRILELAPRRHALLVVVNHLVWDDYSFNLFLSEVDRSYRRIRGDGSLNLPALPIQFPDYTDWHRSWVETEDCRAQVSEVADDLRDYAKYFELPTDYQRPATANYGGATVAFDLPEHYADKMVALCKRYNATPFMFLTAAFKFVLHRFSGQNDIAIGSFVQNRNREELENLVGLFVNTVVIRTKLHGIGKFSELLELARRSCLDAMENRHAPMDALVRELAITPDPNTPPLVQVYFSYQDASDRALTIGDIPCRPVSQPVKLADADLKLWVRKRGNTLDGGFDYHNELYSEETIRSLRTAFLRVLETVIENPDIPLSSIKLVTSQQQSVHTKQWVRRGESLPDALIFELIQRQIRRVPNNPAVSFAEQSLSYREFGERVETVSGSLSALGVRPGDIVGVHLQRSIELLVVLSSLLRLGAAYLPLDPNLPANRLDFISRDAGASAVIIGTDEHAGWLAEGMTVIGLSELHDETRLPGELPDVTAPGKDDPAYLIYTSGSTGQPKGVVVSQSNVVNFLSSMAQYPGMREADRLLAVTTIAFDISVLEFFLPLVVGAEVVIATDDDGRDAEKLAEILSDKSITVFQSTPATWRMLVASGWQGSPGLRALCGGEALSYELANSLRPLVHSLLNMYGPTETTVWSCVSEIEHDVPRRIPLGKPIQNTHIHILDSARQPVPQGAVGELFIGGHGVTLGYHNRPELTAERFLDSPFVQGSRIYATGDLARISGGGELEFLGRIDDQIKVRGYRIELGEIESALQNLDGISQAAVTLRMYSENDHRLLAFVVPEKTAAFSAVRLRKELRKVVPGYMIPQHFSAMQELPLTASKKVDRNALPDTGLGQRRAIKQEPETYAERRLAKIWANAIGAIEIDRRDYFFELGGHSLLAMQVIAEIDKKLGCKVSAGSLMLDTLQQVAAKLDIRDESPMDPDGSASGRVGKSGPAGALQDTVDG